MKSIHQWVAAPLAAAFLLTGCGKKEEPAPLIVRPVYTFEVPEANDNVTRSFSGLVDSAKGADISFEVSGRVIEVIAKEGTRYEEGATLAKIDPTEYQNQLNNAEAQLLQARQERQRISNLITGGNATTSDLEAAIAREKNADSTVNTAKKQLEDTVLKMPYAGIISDVPVDTGQVAGVGEPAVTIQGDGGLQFDIGVPAEIVGQLEPGMEATIQVGALKGEEFAAEIITISPLPDGNTTYPVTLELKETAANVRVGMDGESMIALPNPSGDTVTVPGSSVAKNPDAGAYVWIVQTTEKDLATVERREVETGGIRENGTIEIMTGLAPGDVVVSRGVYRIEDGQTVRISNNS